MKRKIIILTFALFLLPKLIFSQRRGCKSNDGRWIYTTLDAEGDYTNGYVQYEYNYYYERISTNGQCIKNVSSYSPCYIDDNLGRGRDSGWGTLVTYGAVNCPLDNDTWALLLVSVIPVIHYRKKLFKQ